MKEISPYKSQLKKLKLLYDLVKEDPMVNKTNKLPIKDVPVPIDMKATNVRDDLSDDEKKQVSFYLLNRYASAIKGTRAKQELTIPKTNEYYNKNFLH